MITELLGYGVAALLGLIVGSFLNVVADRLPRNRSLIGPGSHCQSCGHYLLPLELIPILSYVVLRGRCRHCSARIPPRVPLVEVAGGVIGLGAWRLYGLAPQAFLAAVFGWLLLVLSVMDMEWHRVARELVLFGIGLAVLSSPFRLGGGALAAMLGMAVLVAPFLLAFLAAGAVYGPGRGMGLGDVLVALLVGAVVGFPAAIVALLATVLIGAGTAIAVLVLGLRGRRDPLPTVPFLALGALCGVLWSAGYLSSFVTK